MAQNITIMGASYSAVPAVTLPKTGGGTARFDDASITTATASDVASGKIFLASNGTITTGTASGGGGASNLVTGTFKFSPSSASAQTVTLNYSGSGYPIAWLFVLNDGVKDATYTSTIARYAIAQIVGTKTYPLQTPTYSTSGESNQAAILSLYKSSTSNASSTTSVATLTSNIFSSSAATDSTSTCIRFNSKTSMSVFAGAPSGTSRYGFFNGLTYRYWIIYSE